MIENMKQQQQQATSVVVAAAAAAQATTSAAGLEALAMPTIATAIAASTPMGPHPSPQPLSPLSDTTAMSSSEHAGKMTTLLQQNTQCSLRLPIHIPSPPSSVACKTVSENYTVGGGVYVSRVNNIHISQYVKGSQHVSLKCGGDMAVNKRVCLDSTALNANTAKVMDKSCSVIGNGMSQPRFLVVRRGGSGGLCWAPYQQRLTTTTTTSATITPRLATTLTTSSPSAAPPSRLPCPGPAAGAPVGRGKRKEVVQDHKERRHMRAINDAFQVLRRALPWVGGTAAEQRPLGTAASKMNTLRLAVRYIRALEHLLEDDSEDGDSSSSETPSSSQSSSCSPSPALSRTSLRSVGSDFSDLLSSDSFDDLDALDELAALSEADPDALMTDTNEKLTA